jgi:hypothetical protein
MKKTYQYMMSEASRDGSAGQWSLIIDQLDLKSVGARLQQAQRPAGTFVVPAGSASPALSPASFPFLSFPFASAGFVFSPGVPGFLGGAAAAGWLAMLTFHNKVNDFSRALLRSLFDFSQTVGKNCRYDNAN